MVHMGRNYSKRLVTIEELATENGLSKKYLEQILLALKTAGLVRSHRGINGGYELSRPPGEISLAEIIRLLDGAIAPVHSVSEYYYKPTPIEQNQGIVTLMREIRDYVSDLLEQKTLEDIM